jgi:glycosyltransferase involved in cell wall biosynthesis
LLYIHAPHCVSPANYQYASTYNNFLFAQAGTDGLEGYLRKNGKNFRRLKTHLTLCRTDFCTNPKKRIAFVGYLWDPRRRDEFAKLFQLLDGTGYCDFYGSASAWQRKGLRSWKGALPLSGPGDVQDVMKNAGIALLLHHKQQFESGSSVYRDFEALSSSCVIISEKTAFMRENFSDCALFIDTDRPVEEIFEQIDAHVQWILAHPEEAMEMARRSHQIFCDRFSLEGECEKILKFVDEISAVSATCQSDSDIIEQEMEKFS